MDDWDNDDFDVTAQLQDKVASLGLENKLKEPTPEPKKEVKSVKKEPSRVANSNRQGDLTQAEIMELQKRGDMECFMDLLGVEKVEKKFADLEDKVDFQEFAQKSSEAFTSRSNHKYYNDFVYSLVDELSKPLTKFQVENLVQLLQGKIKQLAELEKAEKEKQEAAKVARQPKQNKKVVKKEVFDDYVEDEYDDYADRF